MERYLRVNLLGPGPRLMKKTLPGCGLTKVEKHCRRRRANLGGGSVMSPELLYPNEN